MRWAGQRPTENRKGANKTPFSWLRGRDLNLSSVSTTKRLQELGVFCVIHPRSVAGGKRISQTVALAVRLLPGMAHMAISIVDSNDTFRKSLRAFITGLGHEVFEPSTGQEAMDKACSVHPDLIPMERVRKLI